MRHTRCVTDFIKTATRSTEVESRYLYFFLNINIFNFIYIYIKNICFTYFINTIKKA